ncbi:MAG: NEW3 domain-containing protein, partial [Chloroflexota bacterium]
MSSSSRQRIFLTILLMLSALLPLAQPAYANSYVVTSFADSGAGTLRQAITDANNSAGADTITFSSAGTITLSTALPALTGGNITIDGTVPAGGTTPRVELRGNGSVAGQGFLIKSSGNTIRGFIINGFNAGFTADKGGAGIIVSAVSVTAASNNTIEHCYIGTNTDGTDIGYTNKSTNNFYGGVLLLGGASDNVVQNNVISGNFGPGVSMERGNFGSSVGIQRGNIIRNNLIGLNAAGTAALANDGHGVFISNDSNNNIVGPNNTISANGRDSASPPYGVEINGRVDSGGYITGNIVRENQIGTNLSGNNSIPNRGGGVLISSSENTVVGGPSASDKNIISGGDDKPGVAVAEANDTPTGEIRVIDPKIQNNWIGIGSGGTAFSTKGQGVLLHRRVAGVLVTENVISGNRDGVQIIGLIDETDPDRHPRNNTISDNLIGRNPDNTADLPNDRHGVVVRGGTFGNVITDNYIRGNGASGVTLEDDSIYVGVDTPQGTRNNTVSNNEIIDNGPTGVQIRSGSFNNTIGPGNTIRDHNVLNTGAVLIQGTNTVSNTVSNTIEGNVIADNEIGVFVTNSASQNIIGGSGNGDGNQVLNNASHGVLISGTGTDGNTVQNNRVEDNVGNGILVSNSAINNRITGTTTDSNTGQGIALATGGNQEDLSNLPGLSGISVTGTNLSATASNCSGGCTVEIFTDDDPLSDEGPNFLTRATNVNGSFSVSIAGCKPHLIFTITDSVGNTSEFSNPQGPFSQCLPVEPGVALTPANPSTQTVEPGQTVTYEHRVINDGTASGTFNVSISSTEGWATDDFPDGGVVLAPNEFRDFEVTVTVPPGTQIPSEDRTTVTASVGSETAQRIDTTTVAQVAGVAFAPDREQTTPINLPGSETYTHVLTNTGNGQDVFDLVGSVDTGGVTGVTFDFNPSSPITLSPGQAETVEVTVNFPASVSVPLVVTRVEAQSRADGDVSDDVTQTTTIELAPIPRLTPDGQSQSGDPGTSVTYVHTLENIGSESGDFRLDVALPDWNYTIVPNEGDAIPLDPGQTASVTLTVDIPAAALAGDSREATVTASVDGNSVTDDAKDLTTALLVPSLTFVADEARNAGPGETITYVHTLTNMGNGTDTFTVTVSPPGGWEASILPVGEITLDRNASQPMTLTLTVPQGTADGPYDTIVTAQSTSDPAVEESVTDTTTVVPAAVPRFDVPQTQATDPGVTVDFEHTLTNVGNIDGTFDLTVEGLPGGWTSSFTPTASININEGVSTQITVQITPPDGTLAADYDFVVRATAQGGTNATDTVVDTVQVNRKAALDLVSDEANTEPPNTVVTTTHTLTNNGNFTDTVNLIASASEGWAVRPLPPVLDIPAGESDQIEVELTIPPGQVKDLVNTTLVTATSAFSPSVEASVQITTTIAEAPGVLWVEPILSRSGDAGTPITFTFELLNSGSISQTYATEVTDVPDDWMATLVPTSTELLEPGEILPVQLVVQVPEDTPLGTIDEVKLLATSNQADQSDPRGKAEATAIMTVGPQFGAVITPDNEGSALPGQVVRYTHTVTNTGFTT